MANNIRPVQWELENPRVHVYNFNVQQTLPSNIVLTVGYAGSRGRHLLRSADVNTVQPDRLADGTLFFPAGRPRKNPNFSTIELKSSDGDSWYNAGILEVRKRWASGVSFQTSYTFSRNIDTTQASTFFSDGTNGTTTAFPEFEGFNYNKGLADYHAKHNWVTNFTWELPFGKEFAGRSRPVRPRMGTRRNRADAEWESVDRFRESEPVAVAVGALARARHRQRSRQHGGGPDV